MARASSSAARASLVAQDPAVAGCGIGAAADEGPAIEQASYEALAAFRLEIRRFFDFSKRAIEAAGLPPVQYQAMLAIKARRGAEVSISHLARELFIKIQTATELVGRMELGGLVTRCCSVQDKRRIIVALTDHAESKLATLAAMHLDELRVSVPDFIAILSNISAAT